VSFFAGAFAHPPRGTLRPGAFDPLARALSRHPGDHPNRLVTPAFALTWVDLGIFAGGALRGASPAPITLLCGDPVFEGERAILDRGAALEHMHSACIGERFEEFVRARGQFAGVHFDGTKGRLSLIADPLAMRPIYYWRGPEFTLFASSRRVLEAHPDVGRVGDLQSLAELASLGFVTGSRTPIAGMQSVRPGSMLHIDRIGSREVVYAPLDATSDSSANDTEFCHRLRETFIEAVRIRLPTDSHAETSLLSGGLDSRCVAAALRGLHVPTHTISFGPAGSVDRELSAQASRLLGTQHYETGQGAPDFWQRMCDAVRSWEHEVAARAGVRASGRIWSGEGGDRVLAPVNLSPRVIELARQGNIVGAIKEYLRLERVALPRGLFRQTQRHLIDEHPLAGIETEIRRQGALDPGRKFHQYVLTNESRNNIDAHNENLDLYRFEMIMPFYDAKVLALALSHPLDAFLRHQLYYQWLEVLPGKPHTVTWQAYPSSIPCPLPLPPNLRLQWQQWYTDEEVSAHRAQQRNRARELLARENFPEWLISRPRLLAANWLMQLGLSRYAYLFDAAEPFIEYPPRSPAAAAN
jgi:asparagine synthase (glutamine-hydrolysing)